MLEKLTFSKFYLAKSEWISFFFIACESTCQDLSNDVLHVEKFPLLRKLAIFLTFVLFSFFHSSFCSFFLSFIWKCSTRPFQRCIASWKIPSIKKVRNFHFALHFLQPSGRKLCGAGSGPLFSIWRKLTKRK